MDVDSNGSGYEGQIDERLYGADDGVHNYVKDDEPDIESVEVEEE